MSKKTKNLICRNINTIFKKYYKKSISLNCKIAVLTDNYMATDSSIEHNREQFTPLIVSIKKSYQESELISNNGKSDL